MYELLKKLFPVHRSLSGRGNKKTLQILSQINNELKIKSFTSGDEAFDWIVPLEWNVNKAFIKHSSGKIFADFKENNLHLASYSSAINTKLSKKELIKKIFTHKKNPDLIPYITLYYKKDWAFCMSQNQIKKLPDGEYEVLIDSKFTKGRLYYGECFLKGKSSKEIVFSTNICHPSMANNELSGPVVLTHLIKSLKKNKNYFSYRFLFLPETIGAISYISKNLKKLKKDTFSGFIISCVGDNSHFSLIKSPDENNISDLAIQAGLIKKKNKIYSFLDRGSDERQFCSPLVNLPFAGFSRSKYGEYEEYHTSGDNLEFVSEKGLVSSFEFLIQIIRGFELGIYPISKTFCEPNLSKRSLYPSVGKAENRNMNNSKIRLDLIAYSNGKRSIFEIGIKLNVSLAELLDQYEILLEKNVLNSKNE